MAKSLDIIDPKRDLGEDPQEDRKLDREEQVVQASEHEEQSGGLFYLIIGIIAVIVSASLALYILFKDNNSSKTPAASTSATATPAGSPAASATTSVQATTSVVAPAATSSTTTSSTFKYSNEVIRIANGNSTTGEAGRIKTLLEGKGYKIATTDNASKQYPNSIIYYKTGQEKLANALKTDIAAEYTATIELSDAIVGSNDAVVVLGAK